MTTTQEKGPGPEGLREIFESHIGSVIRGALVVQESVVVLLQTVDSKKVAAVSITFGGTP